MVVEPNVGLEITKGVGMVVVQELHGILELVSFDHVGDYMLLEHWEVTVVIEMVVGE